MVTIEGRQMRDYVYLTSDVQEGILEEVVYERGISTTLEMLANVLSAGVSFAHEKGDKEHASKLNLTASELRDLSRKLVSRGL
jgi:hypothetical protein